MSLGNNIKKYRHEAGITQEELANILCVTGQAVSKWESGAGMPDITQVVPLAKALNVSTDSLFGFDSQSYDMKYAKEVIFEADTIRDSGEASQGAYNAVTYLNQKCEENIFNYRIMMRYVQAVAHMSRFVNENNVYYEGLLADNQKQWKQFVKTADNRSQQVIRYSNEKELVDKCHYAMAWLCWHEKEFDNGREHIAQLPSVSSNMLQETLLPYYVNDDPSKGVQPWLDQVRDNYQNFVHVINKQIVYSAESMMWTCPVEEVESSCHWGISVMDAFMENDKMKSHCQGYYRDTVKYLVAAYLRSNEPAKAAAEWKRLILKIDEYVEFCKQASAGDRAQLVAEYGEIAARNMIHYTREWIYDYAYWK